MEIFDSIGSLPLILDLLRRDNLTVQIENEALLALSSLMGIQNDFYYLFEKYRNEKRQPSVLLIEVLDESFEIRKIIDPSLKEIIVDFIQDYQHDAAFVRWLINFGRENLGVRSALLVGVALDIDLIHRESFRFFLSFWAAYLFKKPELIEQ